MDIDHMDYDGKPVEWANQNPWMPMLASRILFVGPSGSGKTNIEMNMIQKGWMEFDRLCVYTKSAQQKMYTKLADMIERVNKKARVTVPFMMESTIDNLVAPEDLDPKQRTIIVVDDFLADKGIRGNSVEDLFFRIRHFNGSIHLLGQSFFTIPKPLRTNCSHYLLFNGACQGTRDIHQMAQAIAGDITFEDFNEIYQNATAQKHGFLYVDKQTNSYRLKYRQGFDGLLSDKVVRRIFRLPASTPLMDEDDIARFKASS